MGHFIMLPVGLIIKFLYLKNSLLKKIMLITLEGAKEKYHFSLTNFCIMPNHIHLLIKPKEGTCLSNIMQWIKTRSAKRLNTIYRTKDHLWGERFFSRPVQTFMDYEYVMNYIDQNPVEAKIVSSPAEWEASGAFHKTHNIPDLIDYFSPEKLHRIKL